MLDWSNGQHEWMEYERLHERSKLAVLRIGRKPALINGLYGAALGGVFTGCDGVRRIGVQPNVQRRHEKPAARDAIDISWPAA